MNTTNPKMFELFCKCAAWHRIAQEDVVNWSAFRRWLTMQLCGIGMFIIALFWEWKQ
jgi:hypothetical protein